MSIYLWIFLCTLLVILELMTVSLVSIWYIISSFFVIVLKLLGLNNWYIEMGVFTILGTIFLIFTRQLLIPFLTKDGEKTNLDRLIGKIFIINEDLDVNEFKYFDVDGKSFRCYTDAKILSGSEVEVISLESTKLKIREVK